MTVAPQPSVRPPSPSVVASPGRYLLTGEPPARTAADLARLLRAIGLGESALNATAVWLARYEGRSAATVRGYVRDCGWWAAWCAHHGIDPTAATALAADAYAAALGTSGLSRASQARRLAAASSWIASLIRVEAADRNPFAGQDRPAVDAAGRGARGLTLGQVEDLLAAADRYGHPRTRTRTRLLITLAVVTLARSATLRAIRVDDLGHDSGHDTLDLTVKGGRRLRVPLPPFALAAVDAHLAVRGRHPGPLLETSAGKAMAPSQVFTTVAGVAELAGLSKITPHSLRATGITLLLDAGVSIELIAELAGHADVRTTKVYDRRSGRRLSRSPAHKLATMLDHT